MKKLSLIVSLFFSLYASAQTEQTLKMQAYTLAKEYAQSKIGPKCTLTELEVFSVDKITESEKLDMQSVEQLGKKVELNNSNYTKSIALKDSLENIYKTNPSAELKKKINNANNSMLEYKAAATYFLASGKRIQAAVAKADDITPLYYRVRFGARYFDASKTKQQEGIEILATTDMKRVVSMQEFMKDAPDFLKL